MREQSGTLYAEVSNRRSQDAKLSALMRASLAGDEMAYVLLLKELPPVLRRVFRSQFNNYQIPQCDREDIIQDVLITLHLRRGRWDSRLPLLPWIFAITRNKIIDDVRRRLRRRDMDLLLQPVYESSNGFLKLDAGHDTGRMLDALPPRSRQIVSSISIEGYSARDLADKLGISEVAVRIVLHRSLKGLSKMFGNCPTEAKPG
jgi:RNA polymerase sigma-70 factor (ECF subfamily)